MEDEKAVAYYEEIARKGEGAARFKRGLGFYSSSSSAPSSQILCNFVKATTSDKTEKKAQLKAIQAKLRRPHRSPSPNFCSSELSRRIGDWNGRSRSSSSERRRKRDRDCRSRRDGRRRSGGGSDVETEGGDECRRPGKNRLRCGSKSRSPSRCSSVRVSKKDRRREDDGSRHTISEKRGVKLDYAHLIEGYLKMTPAERVKAKMKFQLSQTV